MANENKFITLENLDTFKDLIITPITTVDEDFDLYTPVTGFKINDELYRTVPVGEVNDIYSVAIGRNSRAYSRSVSIGDNITMNTYTSAAVVLGTQATVNNHGIAIGAIANAGLESIAIGYNAKADSSLSWSTGHNKEIAIGYSATVSGNHGIAIGASAIAGNSNNEYSVALGTGANGIGADAIAIGHQSKAVIPNSICFDGPYSYSNRTLSLYTLENVFFRNELNDNRNTFASYTNGKTLKQYFQDVYGVIADEYDATATYAVGVYCVHDSKLYKCITAINVAEEWTAAHWSESKTSVDITALQEAVQVLEHDTAKIIDVSSQYDFPGDFDDNQTIQDIYDNYDLVKFAEGTAVVSKSTDYIHFYLITSGGYIYIAAYLYNGENWELDENQVYNLERLLPSYTNLDDGKALIISDTHIPAWTALPAAGTKLYKHSMYVENNDAEYTFTIINWTGNAFTNQSFSASTGETCIAISIETSYDYWLFLPTYVDYNPTNHELSVVGNTTSQTISNVTSITDIVTPL